MNILEKIEDKYKEYDFHVICFPDNLRKLHGYIDCGHIYINKNDPIELQAKTALHEITHAECDYGHNLLDRRPVQTIKAEGFATRMANREVKKYLS